MLTNSHFNYLFKSFGVRKYKNVLRDVYLVVDNKVNNYLSLVTREQVKESVLSLGAKKALGSDGFQGIFFLV